MSNGKRRDGACLCGAVRISANRTNTDLGACHCALCQTWAGGPVLEIECGSDVEFSGVDNIAVYESSKRAQRGFCKICGTHLFIKSIPEDEYGIPPGLFHDTEGIVFARQVFIDHKPAYYDFSNATRNITSAFIYGHYPETRDDT